MSLFTKDMNEVYAKEILTWKYEAPFDFYNIDFSDEALEELLNNNYFAIVNDTNQLIGFFCFGKAAQVPIGERYGAYTEDMVDFGLGMKPDLTGQGKGFEFLTFILDSIRETEKKPLRLTVASFNKRAIKLYEKLGFVKEMTFLLKETEFDTMIQKR
ncbi:GNAT family N-acetyltransferase [Neobacillus sp. D3-1R]|uniref:GNAT family N-acetyltransferase n=1 Tax=Neobacillus sp. D3-1R TaxID=3445778 RepID=UPI003FA121F9